MPTGDLRRPPLPPAWNVWHELQRSRDAELVDDRTARMFAAGKALAANRKMKRGDQKMMMKESAWRIGAQAFCWIFAAAWSVVYWPFAWSRKKPTAPPAARLRAHDETARLLMQMRRAAQSVDCDPAWWRERVFKLVEEDFPEEMESQVKARAAPP